MEFVNQDEDPVYLKTSVSGNVSKVYMTVNREGRLIDLAFSLDAGGMRSELRCGQYNLNRNYRLADIQQFDWRVKPTPPAGLRLAMFQQFITGVETEQTFTIPGGLIWPKSDDGEKRTWQQGIDYCEQLDFAGTSDWRLPSAKELQSVLDLGFSDLMRSSYYWSSTTFADDASGAWFMHVYNGNGDYYNKASFSYYVRCVRGGLGN